MDEPSRVRKARTQRVATTRSLEGGAGIPVRDRLRELIAAVRELLSGLPPELAALMGPLLQLAQGMLLSGASEAEILQMIARLEQVVGLLVALKDALGRAGPDGPRLLARLLRTLALAGPARAQGEMDRILRALRDLMPHGTEGLDQVLAESGPEVPAGPGRSADGADAVAGLEGWLLQAFPPKQ